MVHHLGKLLYAAYFLGTLFILINSFSQPAYAYVDPGSGLLLLQILGSTVAGMSFFLRKKIRSFFGWFGKSSAKGGSDLADN
jgi:hypothetical protein